MTRDYIGYENKTQHFVHVSIMHLNINIWIVRTRFVRGYVVLVGFKRGPVNCNGKHVNLMKPEPKQQYHKKYVWEVWYFETNILSTIVDILTYTWNIASL